MPKELHKLYECLFFFLAFWITHRVVKIYVDDDEGLVPSKYDTSTVKKAIFEYFKLRTNVDLLEPLYRFKKSQFSALCKKLSEC